MMHLFVCPAHPTTLIPSRPMEQTDGRFREAISRQETHIEMNMDGEQQQHSLTMSFLVFQPVFCYYTILHTFLHPVLITFSHHMSIPSQSTTSNESCDRLNFNQPSQFFICPSVFQLDTTHPSNHQHLCSFKLQPDIN